MSEKIPDRDETNTGTHEVGGECMPQPMRTQRHADMAALAPGAHALVDGAAA